MIKYECGYKYQLVETYFIQLPVPIIPTEQINTDWIALDKTGRLVVQKGYAWDGASGPTLQTKDTMRGSLVHDALYQLLREKYIDEHWRKEADENLHTILLQDGMGRFRAWYYLAGVRLFGGPSADPANDKQVQEAP